MRKVLVLTHEYYPYYGGVGRYCFNLCRYLPAGSFLVATDQRDAAGDSVMYVNLTNRFIKPSWILGLFRVLHLVKKHQIRVVLTPHILPLGVIAYLLRRFWSIPYVISLHGYDINLALKRRPWLTRTILQSAHWIIANSNATKHIVDPLAITVPVEVLTPCFERSELPYHASTVERIKKIYRDKKIILTVGRLVRRKGQAEVVRALPSVLEEVPDAHYIIIGQGPDRAFLKDLITQYHLNDHVSLLQHVPDEELVAYFEAASVFAMPTQANNGDIEGFGIVYLQAAAFSLPIIAGTTSGEREAVGDESCGVFIHGGDERGLARALIALLTDRAYATKLGQCARHHLESLPQWKDQAQKLITILSHVT